MSYPEATLSMSSHASIHTYIEYCANHLIHTTYVIKWSLQTTKRIRLPSDEQRIPISWLKSAQEEDDKNCNSVSFLSKISRLRIQCTIRKLHPRCRATYTSIHTSNVTQTDLMQWQWLNYTDISSLRCHWACRHFGLSLSAFSFLSFFLFCPQIVRRLSRQLTTSEAGDRAHDFHAMVEQRCGSHAHQEEAQGDGQSSPSPNNPGSRHLHLHQSRIHTISPVFLFTA